MLKKQLAEYLHRYHHGAENAVTSKELEHTFVFPVRNCATLSTACVAKASLSPAIKADIFTQEPKRKSG